MPTKAHDPAAERSVSTCLSVTSVVNEKEGEVIMEVYCKGIDIKVTFRTVFLMTVSQKATKDFLGIPYSLKKTP